MIPDAFDISEEVGNLKEGPDDAISTIGIKMMPIIIATITKAVMLPSNFALLYSLSTIHVKLTNLYIVNHFNNY